VEHFYGFIGSTWKIPEGMITDLTLTNFEDKHLHDGHLIFCIKFSLMFWLIHSFVSALDHRTEPIQGR